MRYFKTKIVVEDYTTKRIIIPEGITNYCYAEIDRYEYSGVDTEDENFLINQHPECEAEEVTFAEIETILKSCKLYADVNELVVNKIREKYDVNAEAEMLNKGIINSSDAAYLTYRTYVEECIAWGNLKKQDYGLVE